MTRRAGAREVLALVLALAFSAFVFFYNLEQGSMMPDDVLHIQAGMEYLHGDFHSHLKHPFLGKYLIGLSLRLFGRSDAAARLPGALFGLLTGLALFLLAQEVTCFQVGVGALCLWSISPMSKYLRTAHLDSFLLFFQVVTLYLFWRMLTRRRIADALVTGLALGLALSAKSTATILLLIMPLGVLSLSVKNKAVFGGDVTRLLLATVVALCVAVAVHGPVLGRLPAIISGKSLPHWRDVQSGGWRIVVNGVVYDKPPWWIYFHWYHERYSPAVLALFAAGVGFCLWRRERIDIFLLVSLLTLYGFFFLFSAKFPRFLAPMEPILILLACQVLFSVHMHAERWAQLGHLSLLRRLWTAGVRSGLLALLLMAHAGVATIRARFEQGPGGAKAVAAYLQGVLPPESTVLVWGCPEVFRWYLGQRATIVGGPHTAHVRSAYNAACIIVDPEMRASWPDDPLATHLQRKQVSYSRQVVAGFEVFIRPR